MNLAKPEPDYSNITIAEFLDHHADTAMSYAIRFSLSRCHKSRTILISKIIDILCNDLERNKNDKTQDKVSEDSLTMELIRILNSLNIQTSHDKFVNGHCDIVVEAPGGFLWLAEAKIHSAYDWLAKGYKQLADRYSTGVSGQDTGSIIIYCWIANSSNVLERWRTKLIELFPDVTVDAQIDSDLLTFSSSHQHSGTGRPFVIRHKIVSLFFAPTDK